MIPKIIHYCWFGKAEKNEIIKQYMHTWEKKLPDYQIIEWNEDNCDIASAPKFVQEAYMKKKWAFVSDYFRLVALIKYGGIYLDTDIELVKNFDDLLNLDLFFCFESAGYICTAVIGAKKENDILIKFKKKYEQMEFSEVPNSKLLYDLLLDDIVDISSNYNLSDSEVIFSSDYFSPKDFYSDKILITDNTVCIHHFTSTWKSKKKKFGDKIRKLIYNILGPKKYIKFKNFLKNK